MSRSLWMGDLDTYMDETFINRAFLPISQPVSVKVIRKKETGQLAGYCFIEFATEAEAERVLKLVNATDIPGSQPTKRFRLNRSQAGRMWDVGPSHSVFVGDLDATVTDDKLEDFFSKRYRSVKGAKIMWEERGFSRGYGFVRFSCETEMKRALVEMQGAQGLGNKPIRVSVATPKGKTADGSSTLSSAVTTSSTTAMDTYTQWMQQQQAYAPYQYYQQYYQQYYGYSQGQQYATAAGYYGQQQQQSTNALAQQSQQYAASQQQQYTADQQQQQYYNYASNTDSQKQQQSKTNGSQASSRLAEDPLQPVDVNAENLKYFVERTGILNEILGGHWQPVDSLTSKIAELNQSSSTHQQHPSLSVST